MPRMLNIGRNHRSLIRIHRGNSSTIALRYSVTFFPHSIASCQLCKSERSLEVGHIVFVAYIEDFIAPGTFGGIAFIGILADTVQAEDAHAIREVRILRCDHSALAGRQRLGGIEGEARDVAETSHHFALVACWQRMSRILDHPQVVAARGVEDTLNARGAPRVVDYNDGAGTRGDC